MLDAGVHISDKRTLLKKTHRPFQTAQNILSESPSALTNGEETADSIISKMLSDRSSVMNKSNTLFNERRENLFKENIPVFSVQGNRAVFPFSRKIW
jgi:hypothetical protein